MDTPNPTAERLCRIVVQHPNIPNPTVKVGAWIVGRAADQGGFPVELTFRQIQAATGAHNRTIREAVERLADLGLFRTQAGAHSGGAHRAVRFLENDK